MNKINKLCVFVALAGTTVLVQAQTTYPTRTVRLIVPSSPGGGTDISARILAPQLTQFLGQQVIVENRPGAATMIGGEAVVRAAPDGYTLGYVTTAWGGLVAPLGTPRDIIVKLNAEVNRALQSSQLKERYAAIDAEAVGGTIAEFAEFVKKESVKWGEVVRKSGAKLD